MLVENGNDRAENEVALGQDLVAVELELHLLRNLDLVLLDPCGRAPIGFWIVGFLAGNVRTGVVLIGDAILVSIGWRRGTAVGLGVVRLHTRHVRARVLRVDDAVVVSIGGTAVGLG